MSFWKLLSLITITIIKFCVWALRITALQQRVLARMQRKAFYLKMLVSYTAQRRNHLGDDILYCGKISLYRTIMKVIFKKGVGENEFNSFMISATKEQ